MVPKTLEEAALAVDEMLNLAFQNSGGNRDALFFHNVVLRNLLPVAPGEDSGEDSGDEGERPEEDEDGDEDNGAPESPVSSLIMYTTPF